MSNPGKDAEKFDFAAAEELRSILTQLNEKIQWLAWVRSTQGKALLDPVAGRWQGGKRTQFDKESGSHRAALTALAAEALALRGHVDGAIATATADLRASRD
ncbi:hypothetical protein [Streptomyces misionensis]|uniref:hypothetical protein n=1 Tax=Streptomyces misionensis TaxID=67331 RepID=UPI00396B9979